MREECKHFQSRTYANGDVARMCELDLAPEAPWRCPAECPSFERRLADVNWQHGSLVTPPPTEEPEGFDASSIELLDEAEAIINAAAPDALDEVERQRAKEDRTRPRDGWLRGRFKRR
ncbi:MAG TPA: hypothetical protein VGI06_18705 [Acidimicrobiales bacterium]|jgi:hypothetical protein